MAPVAVLVLCREQAPSYVVPRPDNQRDGRVEEAVHHAQRESERSCGEPLLAVPGVYLWPADEQQDGRRHQQAQGSGAPGAGVVEKLYCERRTELQRLGTVTAVAKALQYTHSAISQQLAHCERDVGRRIRLTEQGEILAEYAGRMRALSDEAEFRILASTSLVRGTIRVTSFQTATQHALARAPELEV